MKHFLIAFFVNCVLAMPVAAGAPLPRFADYPATETFSGPPANPDFANAPDAKQFATRIREGAQQGPNFAGRFIVIDWGCGSECQSFVIMDAKTGAIFFPSFTSSWGLLYKRDSNLLIINPLTPDAMAGGPPPEWLVSRYYTWDGKKLTQIAENRTVTIDPHTGAAPEPERPKKLTIVDYFNLTKREGEPKIVQINGSWCMENPDGPLALSVTDIANGYLEYDEHFGDGHSTVSVALFMTKDKAPMLAELDVLNYGATCAPSGYVLKTFRMNNDRMTLATDIVPALPLSLFLAKGYTPKKGERFQLPGTVLRVGFKLPQKGTTLEAFLYTSTLACSLENFGNEWSAGEREAVREFLANVRKEPLKLKWNKTTGRFDLQPVM